MDFPVHIIQLVADLYREQESGVRTGFNLVTSPELGYTTFIINKSCGAYWRHTMRERQSEGEERPLCGLQISR